MVDVAGRRESARDGRTGEARKNASGRGDPLREMDLYRLIFDSMHSGIMVTDAEGYILHINRPYGRFLGIDPEAHTGRHCTEVVENTRMHIVGSTGEPEINHTQLIKGQRIVVQRIPVRKDGEVVAVFGQVMFKDVRDLTKLAGKLSVLESKLELYERELMSIRSTRHTFESIVGESEVINALKHEALRAAATQFPVLITGESGTGKELFAQGIHHASPRRLHPFVRINCAAIPKDLLESELFGYEKGAFTGAQSNGKPGKFELARQGTVFLDEIGDLPLQMQPKLLRVLEEKEFERVGGTKVIRSDFRLIAATNHNLEEMVADRRFRKDLFYRLNVIPLNVPPLRERREDVIPVAIHLLKQMSQEESFPEIKIDEDARAAFVGYDWPGNVRELSNVLYRIVSSLDGDTIHLCDLPFFLYRSKKTAPRQTRTSLKDVHHKAEEEAIRYALKATGNNKAGAARMLGIHRTLLYKKIKKYGISCDADVKVDAGP